jgi:hypothetical protein
VNVLDEDIPKGQRLLLESWPVRVSQIGVHIGQRGMADEAIPLTLLRRRRPIFLTRDDWLRSEPVGSATRNAGESNSPAQSGRSRLEADSFGSPLQWTFPPTQPGNSIPWRRGPRSITSTRTRERVLYPLTANTVTGRVNPFNVTGSRLSKR